MMPPLKLLRNVIDRMKNIHDYFIITANMAGELTLKVETDMVSVATFYTNLDHPQIGMPKPCFSRPYPRESALTTTRTCRGSQSAAERPGQDGGGEGGHQEVQPFPVQLPSESHQRDPVYHRKHCPRASRPARGTRTTSPLHHHLFLAPCASALTYRVHASAGPVPHVLHPRSALVSVGGGGKTDLWWVTRCTA